MQTPQNYYAQQGRISDPKQFTARYQDLPGSISELVRTVQNLTLHVFWAERYGLTVTPERMPELQLRTMERRLAHTLELDPAPLCEPRPLGKKLLGNCRDHSLMLASFLRHLGIPARARCGFGAYFMPNHFEDHWVTEYWDQAQARWILVDAQLDALQRQVLGIHFDPLDVPRDQFLVGGMAWQMCRSGAQDPEQFGIFDMHGLGFVRGNLVRDVAALNKVELLPWDCWGVILSEQLDAPGDLQALDDIAALTAGNVPDFERVRSAYETDPRLRMDGWLLSFVNGEMVRVPLPE